MATCIRRATIGLVVFAVAAALAVPAGAVTYKLGSATDLLDSAFYAGQPEDGSNVAGREAFWGRISNDGTTVAFVTLNPNTSAWALFLVDLGDPSSWRRLTPDGVSPTTIAWSPDDSHVFMERNRYDAVTGEAVQPNMQGYLLASSSTTAKAQDNWLYTYADQALADGDILALPILLNGDSDESRAPVILTTFPLGTFEAIWPQIAPDGSAIAFIEQRGLAVPDPFHDVADIYVLDDVPSIMAAPSQPASFISTLAAYWPGDARIVGVELGENFSYAPNFTGDGSLLLYAEDFSQRFGEYAPWWETMPQSDFDVMVAPADGSGIPYRIAEAGNQALATPSRGGTRLVYMEDVAGAMHLFASTLEVASEVTGTPVGPPEDNDVMTTIDQQASDASGTEIDIPSGTTIDFPPGEPQEIQITTPIDPVTTPQLPPGVDAIPVVRQFGPDGTTFNPPISVTITYSDAEVAGLDEAHLRVFRYNTVSGVFDIEVTTIVERDLVNNTISFTISSFSSYGLGANDITNLPVDATWLVILLPLVFIVLGRNRVKQARPAHD